MRKLMKSKGFTLIELMIVVAIIGILAAVAIPKFADLVTKSKEAGVKANIGAIRSAISIYYGDTEGDYPGNLFTSLTTENKYMPPVSGIPSLGRYAIPRHSRGGALQGNVGHQDDLYKSASAFGAVTEETLRTSADDGSAILYLNDDANNDFGDVMVNCTHFDTKSQRWTTY